jgi:tetratricopeptide (TPR) repeat protein
MGKKGWYSLSKKNKQYLDYLVYILFVIYMIYLISTSTDIRLKLVYLLFSLIMICFVFLHEYLDKLYKKAINELTVSCNPVNGLETLSKLEKYDLLKSYRKSILVYKLLAFSDLNKYNEIIELLEKVTIKPFKASYDLLLIYYYSLFLSYISLDDSKKVKEYYNKCMDLKDRKDVRKKIAPILSWNEISGIYNLYQKDYVLAKKYFKKVNVTLLNNREKYLHFFNLSLLKIYDNDFISAKIYLDDIKNNTTSMYITYKSEVIFKIKPKRSEDIYNGIV